MGIMKREDFSENFDVAHFGFWSVVTNTQFLLETFILLLIPWPIGNNGFLSNFLPDTFTHVVTNWTGGGTLHGD